MVKSSGRPTFESKRNELEEKMMSLSEEEEFLITELIKIRKKKDKILKQLKEVEELKKRPEKADEETSELSSSEKDLEEEDFNNFYTWENLKAFCHI